MITTKQAIDIATKPENVLYAGLSRSHKMNLCITANRPLICWKRDRVVVPVDCLYHSSFRVAHYRMVLDREDGSLIQKLQLPTTDLQGQPC